MLNEQATRLFQSFVDRAEQIGCGVETIDSTSVLDAGVHSPGSISAGLLLARLCLGDRASVALHPADSDRVVTDNVVYVQTDDPVRACLGGQYAGWPVQTDDYFAMGSGPMRMVRGREKLLEELALKESASHVVGVLESDKLPSPAAIQAIASDCRVAAEAVSLGVAPASSLAGSLQVVARSIETAMHKLHELEFDVGSVVSATGQAPLPPPAKPGDMVGGIGRTNDAMLYGAIVTLWVDHDDDVIADTAAKVPSSSSDDYGEPFAEISKNYDYDFYKVDPSLFSPAVVTFHNLRSGRTWTKGTIETDILRRSFLK